MTERDKQAKASRANVIYEILKHSEQGSVNNVVIKYPGRFAGMYSHRRKDVKSSLNVMYLRGQVLLQVKTAIGG